MSNYDTDFYTALVSLCTGTWSVAGASVLSLNQALRINWQNEAELGNLTFPAAIISLGRPSQEDVSSDAACYRYPASLTFIRLANLSTAETNANTTIRAIMEAQYSSMRDAIITANSSAFQLLGEQPSKVLDLDDPVGDILFSLNARYSAISVRVAPLVGEHSL